MSSKNKLLDVEMPRSTVIRIQSSPSEDNNLQQKDKENQSNDEDLHSLLPESDTYDDMFLTSFIYLPVPVYYTILLILKFCSYYNYSNNRNSLHNCILEVYFLIFFIPLWIRLLMYYKSYDADSSLFSKLVFLIGTGGCAMFVSESRWKEMKSAPGLKSFPSHFNGGAPLVFAFGLPMLSIIMFAVSHHDPSSTYTIVTVGTYMSALSYLLFGFSAAWFPSKEGIRVVQNKIKMLDIDVRRVRDEVMASSDKYSPLWHEYNWFKKMDFISSRVPLIVCIAVTGMWLIFLRNEQLDLHTLFSKKDIILTLIISNILVWSTIWSWVAFFFADLTSCVQTCILRQEYATDLIKVEKSKTICNYCSDRNNSIIHGFEVWMKAREFIEKFDSNYPLTALTPYFGMQLTFAALGILGVLLIQVSYKGIPFYNVYYWIFVYYGFICTVSAVITGSQIVSINDTVSRQKKYIDQHILAIKLNDYQVNIYNNDDEKENIIKYLEHLKERVESDHKAPKVLGIYVKPTLFRVFQGYVVSGISVILIQYITSQIS